MKWEGHSRVMAECEKAMAKKKQFDVVDGPDSFFFVITQIFGTLTVGMFLFFLTLQRVYGITAPNFDWFIISILLTFPIPFIWITIRRSFESVARTLYKLAHFVAFIWALLIILAVMPVYWVHKGTIELGPATTLGVALIIFIVVNVKLHRWEKAYYKRPIIEQADGVSRD